MKRPTEMMSGPEATGRSDMGRQAARRKGQSHAVVIATTGPQPCVTGAELDPARAFRHVGAADHDEGRFAMTARIAALYRYPVKGLSAEPLAEAELTAAAHFPGDRLFAIENGPSGFDTAAPEHQPKTKFLVLARQAALARLKTRYETASGELSISGEGIDEVRASLASAEGRATIEAFFKRFFGRELAGEPKVLTAPAGFRFMDSRSGFASIINLATVRALEKEVGMTLDPLRFRANIYLEDLPAFAEFDWIDKPIDLGGAKVRGIKRIERCAATTVNLKTAIRDVMIPAVLMRTYGHADCGIYVGVDGAGRIAVGDAVALHLAMAWQRVKETSR